MAYLVPVQENPIVQAFSFYSPILQLSGNNHIVRWDFPGNHDQMPILRDRVEAWDEILPQVR
jgi:hypothetical protein